MAWCLVKEYADKFKQAIKDGKINPDKLIEMSSADRRAYLAKYVGEFNAKYANTLFESKMLLKNQQRGMVNWAKKMVGLTKSQRTELIDRINKMERALDTRTENAFLEDLVEQRLGLKITASEAKTITDLAKKVNEIQDKTSTDYGWAKQRLLKYVRDITPDIVATTRGEYIKRSITTALSLQRAIKTGFDLSAPLRQGRALFGTKVWNRAFMNMFKYAKDPLAFDALEVEMILDPHYADLLKYKNKLGLTQLGETFTRREEKYGSKLIDKVPLLRGSERAFVGFLNDIRFHRFVDTIKGLEKAGKEVTPEMKQQIAEVIGSSTGRGSLGSAEHAAKAFSTVLFSPRYLASRFQMLLNPFMKKGVARKMAIQDLARLAGTSVAFLGLAKMAGVDVETDRRSTDFGKAKIGNTRFDMTSGLAPLIVLMERIRTSSKKTSSGRILPLNEQVYGSDTSMDLISQFIFNKTSPAASVIRDIMNRQDFEGRRISLDFTKLKNDKAFLRYIADQLVLPMIVDDAWEAFMENSDGAVMGTLSIPASLFGVGVNTYKPKIKL